jgi:hypothetical protein
MKHQILYILAFKDETADQSRLGCQRPLAFFGVRLPKIRF